MKKLVLIIPCYLEEEVIEKSFLSLKSLFSDLIARKVISADSGMCFVDDGSSDHTWEKICKIARGNDHISGIRLSRNFGQQFAILAGLEHTVNKYDSYITIDVDLQDDIGVVEDMIMKQEAGANVVYGVRNDRSSDSFFKRTTAQAFYKLLKYMKVKSVYNHSDFRLMDNKFILSLLQYRETNYFLRVIAMDIGYENDVVYYERQERALGKTKYHLRKLFSLAWEGITSFSAFPLRLVLYAGLITFTISLVIGAWVLYVKISGRDIQGWTSLMLVILFFSSLQMIFMGIFGEYLGKIYREVKQRPRYIIEEIVSGTSH